MPCNGWSEEHSPTTRFSSTVRLIKYTSYLPISLMGFVDSGHGGQTEDLDGDEEDGYDEVIYPVDYEANGHIVDDVSGWSADVNTAADSRK